ncbi:interferon-inducible GTPase 5-like [Tiliqua scincoides]|uniref:interferon-inducible GTPase 5-like n=1 Tax=Tiliqua scincoides TaxID=71010 RepID=UPI003462BE9A
MDDLNMEPFVTDDFDEMKAALDQAELPEVIAQARKKFDLFEKTTLDIAITGVTGAGKSSLVNGMRGLDDDDNENNAAKTDVVEGTKQPERYPHPFLPNITMWDLPGIGTENFQAARYLKQVNFDKYDFFIIVSATRFTENDARLAREIQKRKKKFYFVRSKIDVDLENDKRKRDFREEKTLMKIRNDCYQHLEQPRVFLISRWNLDKYDFPLLQMTLETELNVPGKTTLHIAITGMSGTGKSSLVNAMRGLDDGDDKAAKTDAFVGSTDSEGYVHPLFPNVTIWDLPGIGTSVFQVSNYVKQVYFDKYDLFIIVSSMRFSEYDANLVHEIQKRKKKFYFVRSKIDLDLENESRKKDFKEEKTLEKIKNDCYQRLTKSDQLPPRVFLISRWHLDRYDFPRLQMTLEEELDDLKSQVLILAMPAFSREILEKKKKAMKKVIWMQAVLSAALGAIPVPGLSFPCDIAILVGTLRLFCNVFGLDNAAIGKLANRVGKNEAVLRSAIKKTPMASEITPQFVAHLLQKSALCATLMGLELVLDFVPVVGSLTGGGLSFATTFYMLRGFLNDAEEDAKNVLAKVSE